jgi:hypothetical protein
MLFKETVAVYRVNHTEHTNTLCGQNAKLPNAKAGGAYNKGYVRESQSVIFFC